jgi:hypothetical protein
MCVVYGAIERSRLFGSVANMLIFVKFFRDKITLLLIEITTLHFDRKIDA